MKSCDWPQQASELLERHDVRPGMVTRMGATVLQVNGHLMPFGEAERGRDSVEPVAHGGNFRIHGV